MLRLHRRAERLFLAATAMISLTLLFSSFAGIAAANDEPVPSRTPVLGAEAELGKVRTDARELRVAARPLRATTVTKPRAASTRPPVRVTKASSASASLAARATSQKVATAGGGSRSGELVRARALLRSYIARHPILRGTTVEIGKTPGGAQAVAYYTVGRIVISPSHKASLERIIAHEIWHVIDWRDNGRIDWGENVPPRR